MYLAKILSSEMSGLLGKRRHNRQPSSPSSGGNSRYGNSSRRANRTTNQTIEEPVDIDEIDDDPHPAIVDLTQVEDTEIVDLTSSDSPVVYLDNVSDARRRHQRAMRPSQRVNQLHNSVIECSSDEDDSNDENDIQVLPVLNIATHTKRSDNHAASTSTGTSSSSADALSPKRVITCPICMDDEKQIKANKRQLMSTVCGHIFCNKCIRGAVQTQHKCPTCRKKLSMRQFHPIFL
ncbi:E3 ubiquitin-protein ligase RNF4-like [Ptychodera flava]|uniref:E3 ubiquitin-protein ligase RNF4-like n=1 Tax=Ptychodera flava TaxID=63121 RepID=UPI003969DB9E